MAYQIELVDPSGTTATIVDDDILDVDIVRPHTALADFTATIPYSAKAIRDWVTSVAQVRIYYDDQRLFWGYLEKADSDEQDGTTTLEGRGIGRDLLDRELSVRFTDEETHVAIQKVWDQYTDFDATVYNPSAVGSTAKTGQDASTTSDFQDILTLADTDPFVIQNDQVDPVQTAFTTEGESGTTSTADVVSDASFSGGDAIRLDASGESVYWDFTPDHDIPTDDVSVYIRDRVVSDTGRVEFYLGPAGGDLTLVDTLADGSGAFSLKWRDPSGDPVNGNGWTNGDLQAGTTYRFRIDAKSGWDTSVPHEYHADVVAPLDLLTRYDPTPTYTFDNDNGGNSGYLDGPEFFPTDGVGLLFDIVDDDDNIDTADLTTTWDDTSNGQELALSNDGGGSFPLTASNSETLSGDFTTTYGSRLVGRATFAGYGTRSTATPQTGFKFQSLQDWTLKYEASPVNVIEDKLFSGSVKDILQKLHRKAGYRWAIDHGADDANGDPTKVVESFEKGDQERTPDWVVKNVNPTRDVEGYANRVTVYGAIQSDGTRPAATVEDSGEIQTLGGDPDGVRHVVLVRPDMTTLDDVRAEARSELQSRVTERSDTGQLDIKPTNALPGYNYPVDWYDDGNTVSTPSEKVQFSEGFQEASGSVEFTRDRGTAISLVQARYAQSITEDAI